MSEKTQSANFDRLRDHLKQDSLAAQLLHAYRNPQQVSVQEAMKAVLKAQLGKQRANIVSPQA